MRPRYTWMASSSPATWPGRRSSRSASGMRASAANSSGSGDGGGTGRSSSQPSGTRDAGSCASIAWRMVVPVRGAPVTNHGARISSSTTPGSRAHVLARAAGAPRGTAGGTAASSSGPMTVSSASCSSAGSSTSSGSRKSSPPKSAMPPSAMPNVGARLGQQGVARERQLRDLGDRQDAARVDRLHPLRTRRRLPGHASVTGWSPGLGAFDHLLEQVAEHDHVVEVVGLLGVAVRHRSAAWCGSTRWRTAARRTSRTTRGRAARVRTPRA